MSGCVWSGLVLFFFVMIKYSKFFPVGPHHSFYRERTPPSSPRSPTNTSPIPTNTNHNSLLQVMSHAMQGQCPSWPQQQLLCRRLPQSLNTFSLRDAMEKVSRWCYNTEQLVIMPLIYSTARATIAIIVQLDSWPCFFSRLFFVCIGKQNLANSYL